MQDLQVFSWALIIYVVAELALDVVKKSPLWILRQIQRPVQRFIFGELSYLRAIIRAENLKQLEHQYVILRAIKVRASAGTTEASSLLSLLQSYVKHNKQVMLLGAPGSGKTTTLEALVYALARQAYRWQVAVWVVVLSLTFLLIRFSSPWWILLLFGIHLFDFIFRRWPLPLLIDLRRYEGGTVEEFLKNYMTGRVGGPLLSDDLRSYVERGRLAWFLDGVNEVKGGAYESALEGWGEFFDPGHYFGQAPVIFTSRIGELTVR